MFWLAFSWMKSRGEIYTSFRIICSPFPRDRLYCTQPPLPPDSNKFIDAKDKKVKIGTIWFSRGGADWFCKWMVRNTTYLTSWAFSRTSSLPVLYSSLLKSFMLSILFRCSFQILLERNGVFFGEEKGAAIRCSNRATSFRVSFFWEKCHIVSAKFLDCPNLRGVFPKNSFFYSFWKFCSLGFIVL